MKKVSIRIKLCFIIILSLIVGFVVLDAVAVNLIKNEVLSQIKTEDTKLVEAIAMRLTEKLDNGADTAKIQELMDEINSDNDYNYVVYMEADAEGKVVAVAHSNHDRIGIVLDDAGSIAATKDGKAYCDFYIDQVSGLRTLDVLQPIYDESGNLRGAFNIGVPVDNKTLNNITGSAITQFAIISVVIALFVIVLLILSINLLVAKPLGSLGTMFNQVRDGDLSVEYHTGKLNAKDELEYLSADVNHLIGKLKEIVESTQNYSGRLKEHTFSFTQIIADTNEGVSNVAQAMNDVAKGATSQSENTTSAMSRIEELSASLEMIISQIDALNVSAGDMHTLSQSTKGVLGDLVQANEDTKKSVNDIVKQSDETLKAVDEIDSIVKTIDEISTQTNLLSLNASIEAARAGEAGRGFAVVATEIGTLAQNSADSAKQIGNIIKRIQDMIKTSAQLSDQLDKDAVNQMDKLQDTERSIGSVASSVEAIVQSTEQIHAEVKTLDQIKNDIGEVIENLSAISEENAACAEETAASANMMQTNVEKIRDASVEIDSIAEDLNITINYFHE